MAKDTPSIELRFDGRALVPIDPLHAELLDGYAKGTEFRADEMKRRSNRQNSFYWVGLQRIVEATDQWPTKEHLHRALLLACGFHSTTYTLDGTPRIEADSASFSSMNHTRFTQYFKIAKARILVDLGIDWDEMMAMESA